MLDPFKLAGRLFLAFLKIIGYCVAYGAQAVWYMFYGKPEKIGDAIGELGRGITDALAGILKSE